ncbi:phosphatidylserine decarboxylase [Sphingomonas sp. CGMCC 1.13654]|uniref:phosphatidylserine decarboxylase n=1 Tax=Sphingomonas chungangi TaxID=2683589 RepID=A0A838L4Y2_9SPHN|nr:archaetidylserine decarboxylase [Sphingomonas chungangi]MBA2934224.1 phosphatidylserine decarboxylase [Sphingomonas chungangi]MVW57265.1 phosphatidylserine decarboxylase [Sphingomonas chungangi]
MTRRSLLARIGAQEDLNFLLTNRIPRRLATRFMGWLSPIEQPLVRGVSLRLWRTFCDVDLSDAADHHFRSLHHAFTRALKPGSRPADPDPDVLASPSDAIVGACGRVEDGRLYQAKGMPYRIEELVGDAALAAPFREGSFVTLRLTAAMYHRFHAPHDLTVETMRYISGDTWNVNPIALKRVERLFCRNERAPILTRLDRGGHELLIVPVAAILVASMRFTFVDVGQHIRTGGSREIPCSAHIVKGEEMGWFEHGSTIILFAPKGFELLAETGQEIRAGQALMRMPA